jgi:hypothetical protein
MTSNTSISIYLSIYSSMNPSYLSICLSVFLSVYLSIYACIRTVNGSPNQWYSWLSSVNLESTRLRSQVDKDLSWLARQQRMTAQRTQDSGSHQSPQDPTPKTDEIPLRHIKTVVCWMNYVYIFWGRAQNIHFGVNWYGSPNEWLQKKWSSLGGKSLLRPKVEPYTHWNSSIWQENDHHRHVNS